MRRWILILAVLLPACDLTGPDVAEPRGRYELADFTLISQSDTLTQADFSDQSYLYLDFVDDRIVSGEGYLVIERGGQIVDWLFGHFDGRSIAPQPVRGEYILVDDQVDFDLWAEGRYTWIGAFTWKLSRQEHTISVEESAPGQQLRIVLRK